MNIKVTAFTVSKKFYYTFYHISHILILFQVDELVGASEDGLRAKLKGGLQAKN